MKSDSFYSESSPKIRKLSNDINHQLTRKYTLLRTIINHSNINSFFVRDSTNSFLCTTVAKKSDKSNHLNRKSKVFKSHG